jgi:pantoate--beta-alanine ligase
MKVITELGQIKECRSALKPKESLGFVPTMGALHAGHLSLVDKSLKENFITCVSLFVNPTQFNDPSDFEHYPKTLEEDLKVLERVGVDWVFTPKKADLYPDKYRFQVKETEFSQKLCGAYRPGHFEGVLTIVLKLFNLLQPQRAYFGEKDHQQLELIRAMVESFFLPIEILSCPTIREKDGLAMSSRNLRLSEDARTKAPALYKTLKECGDLEEVKDRLRQLGFDVEYVEEHRGRRYAAAYLDQVRLIDNVAK